MSASADYASAAGGTHQPGEGQRTEARLLASVREIHADSGETYGAPRVTA